MSLARRAAKELAARRWAGKTDAEKRAHALMMVQARERAKIERAKAEAAVNGRGK